VTLLYVTGNGASAQTCMMSHIATTLGVRHQEFTTAASRLLRLRTFGMPAAGTALVRPKLESVCCECYAAVNKEPDRLAA
jgi:hypothetical protein